VFTLSEQQITWILLDLHKSGVKIRIITDDDASSNIGPDIKELHQAGIQVRMDNSPAHMHHKFAILDDVCLINGSFNWTKQAHVENKENIILTSNRKIVTPFIAQYKELWNEFEHNPLKLNNLS